MVSQQVVNLRLARAMEHGQPLERALLIGGIMINVGTGMSRKPILDKVNRRLKRRLLLGAVMRPEFVEGLLTILGGDEAE